MSSAEQSTEKERPCNCARYGHAHLCPHHTQDDFEAADHAIGRAFPPGSQTPSGGSAGAGSDHGQPQREVPAAPPEGPAGVSNV